MYTVQNVNKGYFNFDEIITHVHGKLTCAHQELDSLN